MNGSNHRPVNGVSNSNSDNKAGSRRRALRRFRSNSTGTNMAEYIPAASTCFLAPTINVDGSRSKAPRKKMSFDEGGSGYETMDDIGVSGVKPQVRAAREVPSSKTESACSSESASSRRRQRKRLSIVDAGLLAKQGIQETVEVAGGLAAQIKEVGIVDALSTFAVNRISFDRPAAWNARLSCPIVRVGLKVQCRNLPHRTTRHASAFYVLFEVPNGYMGCCGADAASTNTTIKAATAATAATKVIGKPCALPRKQEREIGRSEVVHDSQNPIFTESFSVEYRFEQEQTFLIRVYDEDLAYCSDLKEHDYIGGFVFQLGDLMGRPTHKMIKPLDPETAAATINDAPLVVMKGRELDMSKKFLEFRFRALGLLSSDSYLNMISGPYFQIERRIKDEDHNKNWKPVWKSEVVLRDHDHPTWGTATLSLLEVCGGDLNEKIRVTFWETHSHIPDDYLGYAETTVQELNQTPEDGAILPIRIKKKLFFGAATSQKRGKMQIVKAGLVERPTFLQYIKGGCEIDLVLGVDCRAGVDHDNKDKAVHLHQGAWYNNYQMAIDKIGTIMECYSRTQYFNVWGYNAQASIEQTENLFEMGHNIVGTDGLLKEYNNMFLRGNRFFARHQVSHLGPLITKAIFRSITESKTRHCYSVLCVLTSGNVDDLKATSDALLRAATDAPLSIVFIGCDGNNLNGLKNYFEKTKVQRSILGVRISRDNTTFASFSDFGNDASKVVEEGFRELPEQMVQRFFQSGIDPKPPPTVDPLSLDSIHHRSSHSRDKHRKKLTKSPERSRHKQHSKSPERSRHRKECSRSPDKSQNRRLHRDQ